MIRLMIILAMLLLAGTANARMTMGVYGGGLSGGGGVGPSCSNSADFSAACNSGIAAAVLRGFL